MPKAAQPDKMETSNYKATWPFNHVVLGDHMTNQENYISTMPMTTKFLRNHSHISL